jgi:hypothetical protein
VLLDRVTDDVPRLPIDHLHNTLHLRILLEYNSAM